MQCLSQNSFSNEYVLYFAGYVIYVLKGKMGLVGIIGFALLRASERFVFTISLSTFNIFLLFLLELLLSNANKSVSFVQLMATDSLEFCKHSFRFNCYKCNFQFLKKPVLSAVVIESLTVEMKSTENRLATSPEYPWVKMPESLSLTISGSIAIHHKFGPPCRQPLVTPSFVMESQIVA